MCEIAIEKHKNRGIEVIELLEMLGGNNIYNLTGNDDCAYYVIEYGEIRIGEYIFGNETYKFFTLEEFYKKYPYKVGDRVLIPEYESEGRIDQMIWNGYEVDYMVYRNGCNEWYNVEELKYCNDDFYNAETKTPVGNKVKDNDMENSKSPKNEDDSLLNQLKEYFKNTPSDIIEKDWKEFDKYNEIGPTVKEYLEFVSKFKYPKSYNECCSILGYKASYDLNNIATHDVVYDYKLQRLYVLLICRNAYWKIAGEQMGFDKPWEPDFIDTKEMYYIFYKGYIEKGNQRHPDNHILIFPNPEMRDTFYENFKDLIEQCKEFL